jgi:hypothetical protein
VGIKINNPPIPSLFKAERRFWAALQPHISVRAQTAQERRAAQGAGETALVKYRLPHLPYSPKSATGGRHSQNVSAKKGGCAATGVSMLDSDIMLWLVVCCLLAVDACVFARRRVVHL